MPGLSNSIDRFNGVIASLAIKAPCVAVAITNITLSGEQTVNGVAVVSGDRVLVTAQTSAVNNGIYDVTSSAWDRAADFDGNRDVVSGTFVTVATATVGRNPYYQITTANPIIIGNTAINFTLADGPNVSYALTQAEDDAGLTDNDINDAFLPGNVLRYGDNTVPGTSDMQPAFDNAQLQMFEDTGANIEIPPDTYLMASQWTITAPANKRCAVMAYGAEIKTSGAISGVQLTLGTTTGGCSIFGLQVNHRGNSDANFGFELFGTANARLIDCSVEHHDTKAGYACYLLRQSDAADIDTGCFWTLIDHCQNRRVSSGDGTVAEASLRLRGTANATVVRDCNFGNAVTCIHHTIESGQTVVANALLVTGCAFEGYTTAIHTEGATASNLAGARFIGNRFENGTTVFSMTTTTSQPSQPHFAMGNMLVSNAGTYLNNPENLYFNGFDLSVTPDGLASLIQDKDITLRSLTEAIQIQTVTGKGIEILNAGGTLLGGIAPRSGGGLQMTAESGSVWYQSRVQGISSGDVEANNLRGNIVFATSGTATVTFGTDEADGSYFIAIAGSANETFWVTGRGTTGFTIHSSNSSSTAVVFWILIR